MVTQSQCTTHNQPLVFKVVAVTLLSLTSSVVMAKTPLLQPSSANHSATSSNGSLLKSEITHAIASANPSLTVPIAVANNPTANGSTADESDGDDGGEVDINPADINSISTNQTTKRPSNSTSTTNSSQDTTAMTQSDAVTEVPLGGVSPNTIAKFVKMIDIIRQEYVNPVDDEMLFDNAMTGTLAGLDPYSEYLDKEAFENLRLFTEGDIGSIGVTVSYHTDVKAWVFDDVLPNSPAAKLGIQRGNYLHQINDNKLEDDRTQQDVDQLLSGIAGTQVKLMVSDHGRRKHMVIVQRTLIQQQTIAAKIVQDIAVVHIPVFQNNTQQQLLAALSKLNQPFGMIILDLRNNPGGVLSAANDIASLFMQNKTVVQVKNRQGLQEVINTHGEAKFAEIPLIILQNRYSASAAEVLASSLQDNGRAQIYGETSYGKGSIQSIIPLNDEEAVKLTVAHYFSAKGVKIDGVGVKPDVVLTGLETTWIDDIIKQVQAVPRANQYQIQEPPTPQAF